MDSLIGLLISILAFALVAYGLHWVCVSFSLPQPILWICGVILLIILLMYAARMTGSLPVRIPTLR